jgi:streptogramin lyase
MPALFELPLGFHVTLFAGEPDVQQPIAFDFDDTGRVWVAENYSYGAHGQYDPALRDRIVWGRGSYRFSRCLTSQ